MGAHIVQNKEMRDSTHYEYQRVIGKLEEFREWGRARFDSIEKQFDEIHKELEKINRFRWQIYGASLAISAVFTIAFQILKGMFHGA